jgi:lipid II:glycine glycyltransferase (peptidoglycan interpeptide bridge formation enzyme)
MATRVRINRGMMQVTREERSTRHYEIRNADDTAREVVIEHPIRANFKLVSDAKPDESSTNFHRFKIKIDPKKTQVLDVKEVRPDVAVVYLNSITDDQVAYFARETKLKPEVEQALRRIVAKKGEIGAVDRNLSLRQRELNDIDRDQTRVRENMKALKGSAEEKELLQRYARQLNSQEDRLNALRSEISGLQDKRAKVQTELEQMIEGVDVEEEVSGR